eukprot:COSAG01_NODE_34534_length_546_cov_0.758389_1_plen_27_part_10
MQGGAGWGGDNSFGSVGSCKVARGGGG